MFDLSDSVVRAPQIFGFSFVAGIVFLLFLRSIERLVLLPYFGFIFSALFLIFGNAVSFAANGAAVLLLLIGIGATINGTQVDVGEAVLLAGIPLVYVTTYSTWTDLLEARLEKTGSTAILVSLFGQKVNSFFGVAVPVTWAFLQAIASIALVIYVVATMSGYWG